MFYKMKKEVGFIMITTKQVAKITILLLGILLSILLQDGRLIFIFSMTFLLLYLAVDFKRITNTIQIDTIWIISYIFLISLEGIFDANFITARVGQGVYDSAAMYLNIINFAFLTGFNIVRRQWPSIKERKIEIQVSSFYMPILLLFYTVYLFISVPEALDIAIQGRGTALVNAGRIQGVGGLISETLGQIGLFLPAALAFHFIFLRSLNRYKALFYTLLSVFPILLIQSVGGTRFVLITSVISIAIIYIVRYPQGFARVPKLVLSLPIAVAFTILMRETRDRGLSGGLQGNIDSQDGRFFLSEGAVEYFAKMLPYFNQMGFREGMEHLTMFSFWIPRIFWPDKPTQLEYWLVRALGERGFSDSHSIAATFAATAYADFGIYGALVMWTLSGVFAGWLNNRFSRHLYESRPSYRLIMVAVLSALVFFATRQISTVIFLAFAIVIFTFVYSFGFQRNEEIKMNKLGLRTRGTALRTDIVPPGKGKR